MQRGVLNLSLLHTSMVEGDVQTSVFEPCLMTYWVDQHFVPPRGFRFLVQYFYFSCFRRVHRVVVFLLMTNEVPFVSA